MGELLTSRELAKLLRVSTNTVHHWRRAGKIPFLRGGRPVLYDVSDVKAALSRKPEPAIG